MVTLISFLLNLVASLFKSKGRLDAENAALRHQLVVLQRKVRGRVHFTDSDRLSFIEPLSLVSVCPQCYFYHPARDPCALASCPLCAGIVPADAVPRLREPARVAPSGCGAPPESHALLLRDEKNCSKGRNNKADLGNH